MLRLVFLLCSLLALQQPVLALVARDEFLDLISSLNAGKFTATTTSSAVESTAEPQPYSEPEEEEVFSGEKPFGSNPDWAPWVDNEGSRGTMTADFFDSDRIVPPMNDYNDEDFLRFEFLTCGEWGGIESDKKMECHHLGGSVMPDGEVHLQAIGTHFLVGTCFFYPGQLSLKGLLGVGVEGPNEDAEFVHEFGLTNGTASMHIKSQIQNGLCEYNVKKIDMIKVSNLCRLVEGTRICDGKTYPEQVQA